MTQYVMTLKAKEQILFETSYNSKENFIQGYSHILCDIKKKSNRAKYTGHTAQRHGRDFDLGLLLSCYSSGDQHNLSDSQSLILKNLKAVKIPQGLFCGFQYALGGKGQRINRRLQPPE